MYDIHVFRESFAFDENCHSVTGILWLAFILDISIEYSLFCQANSKSHFYIQSRKTRIARLNCMYLRKCNVTISLEHPYCPFSFFLSQKPASFKNIPFAFIFLAIYNVEYALSLCCMSCSRYIGLSECQTTKIDRKIWYQNVIKRKQEWWLI